MALGSSSPKVDVIDFRLKQRSTSQARN